jgi:hypothetical protein
MAAVMGTTVVAMGITAVVTGTMEVVMVVAMAGTNYYC